jgi:hypothetical protein
MSESTGDGVGSPGLSEKGGVVCVECQLGVRGMCHVGNVDSEESCG